MDLRRATPDHLPDVALPPGVRVARARRRVRSLAWRGRFVVAAVCCGLAATGVVRELRPAPPPAQDVVVAARDLPAGATLAARDVTVARVPDALVPHGALTRPADAVGRTASVALAARTPLQPTLVAAGEVVASAPEGTVVAPVRLDPAVAALLSAGDRVDLLLAGAGEAGKEAGSAAGTGPAEVAHEHEADHAGAREEGDAESAADPGDDPYLARGAVVLPGRTAERAGGGLLGAPPDEHDGVVLVAVLPVEAVRLASASAWSAVTAVLVR